MKPFITIIGMALASSVAVQGQVALLETFDGGGVNSTYNVTVTSGATAPAVMSGGPTENFLRVTYLEQSNNRSVAWDYVPIGGKQVGIYFDFRMTDDAANAGAGGCCGQAADGLGIGLFSTATYGMTGGINPGDGNEWENSAFDDALVLHFDIFDSGGGQGTPDGNQAKLTWNGSLLINATPSFEINNNVFNRAALILSDAGSDSVASLRLIEDVNGAAVIHDVFQVTVPGLDLDAGALPYRLIVGGRTGGAYHNGDLDNIVITGVPEPATYALVGLGFGLLALLRRKR